MKKRYATPAGAAEVNMTPMLDIVFIMLIFFIVTSTMVREKGLDVTQHQNNQEQIEKNDSKAILIQVCANDDILVDRRVIDIRSVRANVERQLAKAPNSPVVIETEPEAPTGTLVEVMDQAIEARAAVSIAPATDRCGSITAVVSR